MVYIQQMGRNGDTTVYSIQLNIDRVEAMLSQSPCMRVNGETLDRDLTSIVLDELVESMSAEADPSYVERVNEIFKAFGRKVIGYRDSQLQRGLSSEARKEIKEAFRDWDGSPNPKQKEVMKRYGLEYAQGNGGNYGKIRETSNPGNSIPVANTPSAQSSGRNIGGDICRYIMPNVKGRYN
jgi:hypothetical protein